jgi:hypothetical protein
VKESPQSKLNFNSNGLKTKAMTKYSSKPFGVTILWRCWLLASVIGVYGRQKRPPYTEEQRRQEYINRGHTFPIKEYLPNTAGWTALMEQRLTQVRALTDPQMKWDGWTQLLSSALTVPNFTEYGWGLT